MQYVSALFGLTEKTLTIPNVLFFDSRDGVTKAQMRDMTYAKANAHKARTFLGVGGWLNPVAGQYGNKYFPTFSKYAVDKDWAPLTYDPIMQENTVGFSIHASDGSADYVSYDADRALYVANYTIRKGTVLVNCPADIVLHTPKICAAHTQQNYTQMGRFPSTLHFRSFNGSIISSAAITSDQFHVGVGYQSLDPVDVYTTYASNFRYAMACKAINVATELNSFADIYLEYRDDGLFYGPRVASDETVNLDFGLFYWKAFNTLVMLDQNDYVVDSDLVPGTRPKFRVKPARLLL